MDRFVFFPPLSFPSPYSTNASTMPSPPIYIHNLSDIQTPHEDTDHSSALNPTEDLATFSYELSEEAIEMFAKQEQRRAQRKRQKLEEQEQERKQRKLEEQKQREAYKRKHHRSSEIDKKAQRDKAKLYGAELPKVQSWEMALDQIYDHVTNMKKPVMWPFTPLNLSGT